jgi:hypothetical protein
MEQQPITPEEKQRRQELIQGLALVRPRHLPIGQPTARGFLPPRRCSAKIASVGGMVYCYGTIQ